MCVVDQASDHVSLITCHLTIKRADSPNVSSAREDGTFSTQKIFTLRLHGGHDSASVLGRTDWSFQVARPLELVISSYCTVLLMADPTSSENASERSRLLSDDISMRDRLQNVLPRLKARARLFRRRFTTDSDASLTERLEAIDPEFVEDGARDVTESDVETVVEEADAIEERFRDNGPLRRLLDDGRLLLTLVRDTWQGRYPDVPWWTVSGAAFALLYVLNPLDLVPDALPLVGVLDDAAVVSACLVLLEQDLHDYKRWLQAHAEEDRRGWDVPSES